MQKLTLPFFSAIPLHILMEPIRKYLGLSLGAGNALENVGITRVWHMLLYLEHEWFFKNFGPTRRAELIEKMRDKGLTPGALAKFGAFWRQEITFAHAEGLPHTLPLFSLVDAPEGTDYTIWQASSALVTPQDGHTTVGALAEAFLAKHGVTREMSIEALFSNELTPMAP